MAENFALAFEIDRRSMRGHVGRRVDTGTGPTTGRRSRPTLADIAAEAGVSTATVSKVLNGRTDVADATRERVAGLLRAHEYLPPGQRRARRSGLVDLVIGGPQEMLCIQARVDGYRAALEHAGLESDRALIRYGGFRYEGGFRAARDLLGSPDRPTAIFAGSDQQAMGVYEAARQAGLSVPTDLSVVGFDDPPPADRRVPARR